MNLNIDGCIPVGKECPFRSKCELALNNTCKHKGEQHSVPYSCAVARAFDLTTGSDHEAKAE